MTTIQENL